MNIDEMQPGPDLDQLVAIEVLSWTIYTDYEPRFWLTDGESNGWAVDDFDAREVTRTGVTEIVAHSGVFRPSVDWGAAGIVLDAVRLLPWCHHVRVEGSVYITVVIFRGEKGALICHSSGGACAKTAPLAICRAALKAVGIDKV